MRRAPGVDQRDLMPSLLQMMGSPGAEHAGANHGDMVLHAAMVGLCERR